jgi:N-acetylmuramoyl-L-alanine amidase
MRKIFISAGHSNKIGRDRGAEGNGFIEGELSVEFRKILTNELIKLGITPTNDGDNTIINDSLAFFKNKTSPDSIVLDIHWNSATPQATGTETLIPGENTEFERKLAKDLNTTVSTTLGILSRGVKTELDSHHGRLGWMRLTGENVLLEVCFISNKEDMKKYQTNKDVLAQKIAEVLYNYANQGTNTPPIIPSQIYTVQKGDTLTKIAKSNNITLAELVVLNNIVKGSTLKIGQILKIK